MTNLSEYSRQLEEAIAFFILDEDDGFQSNTVPITGVPIAVPATGTDGIGTDSQVPTTVPTATVPANPPALPSDPSTHSAPANNAGTIAPYILPATANPPWYEQAKEREAERLRRKASTAPITDEEFRERARENGKKGGRPRKYEKPEGMSEEAYRKMARKLNEKQNLAKKHKDYILNGQLVLPPSPVKTSPVPTVAEPELMRRWKELVDACDQYDKEIQDLRAWISHKGQLLNGLQQKYFEHISILIEEGWDPIADSESWK